MKKSELAARIANLEEEVYRLRRTVAALQYPTYIPGRPPRPPQIPQKSPVSWTEQIHDCVGEELDTGEDRY